MDAAFLNMPFLKYILARSFTAPADTSCRSAKFSVPGWQGNSTGGWTWKLEVVSCPSASLSFTPAPEPQLCAVDLQLSSLLTGKSRLLAKRVPATSAAEGEVLPVTVSSCAGRSRTALLRSCDMGKGLCCDEQVALKEQGAGISLLISWQCQQKEFSRGCSSVGGREGTAGDLPSLLLMKVASATDTECGSRSRGSQEADTQFLPVYVALISLYTCLQK